MKFSLCSFALPALTALVLLAAGTESSRAAAFLIDFGGANTTSNGPSPDDPVHYWNNVSTAVGTSDSGVLSNLVTTSNEATTASLVMIRRFNGVNENGTLESTLYPADATRDSLYGNTGEFGGLSNIFPAFKITGLDPSTAYDFTFYASRMGVTDNRETGYTLEGANSGFAALDAANNVDGFATAAGIFPTAGGEITISIAPTDNNTNAGTRFTYLGVLRVESSPIPEPSAAALAAIGLLTLTRRGKRA